MTTRAVLAALPVVLALAAYYRDQLAGAPLPRPQGDAAFYAYQLIRAAECHGQWWRIVEDRRLGHPYPTEVAKHPGLYEGVDLMLLAALTAGALGAAGTYHMAVVAALAFNGWIAAWIVMRTTRRALWAAAAVTLLTLNQSVAVRIVGHLHLFKFGWILMAVWAFVAFREQPTWRRGLLLGVAAALVLQASFYLGFLMMLGLGFWYVVEALAGRLARSHYRATVVAALAFALLGAAFTFPVWTGSSAIVAGSQYFHREWSETWTYGSELWKYLVPRGSGLSLAYYRDVRLRATPPSMDEGWNFPGYTVLLAVLFAVLSRLRPSATHRGGPFVTVSLGLMAFWTVLSLAGGPSALIYYLAPSFRCYGRSGLLVVALGSVVAPIILCELVRAPRRRLVRVALALAALVLVAGDACRAALSFPGWTIEPKPPAWVEWLKHEPPDTRLAAFAMPEPELIPFDWWGSRALEWLPLHGHATFNGGDYALFEGDLRLLGATYERINPAGLRFVVSLGYETLAFHRDYLAANSWIETLPWLERTAERGDWMICRASSQLPRLPTRTLDQLLGEVRSEPEPRAVPPGCWITGTWPVTEDVIITGSDWAMLAWTNDQGRLLSQPEPALYQHVFGPGVPAYTVRTPVRPGSYRLVVHDRRLHPRATIGYRVVPQLAVSQPEFPARRPGVSVHPVVLQPAPRRGHASSLSLTLLNTSSRYVQAQVFREHLIGESRAHPGLRSRWGKANAGAFVLRIVPLGVAPGERYQGREIPLPQDLPAGGRLNFVVSTDRLPASWADLPIQVEPSFAGVGQVEVPPREADVKISVDWLSTEIAGSRPTSESRTR